MNQKDLVTNVTRSLGGVLRASRRHSASYNSIFFSKIAIIVVSFRGLVDVMNGPIISLLIRPLQSHPTFGGGQRVRPRLAAPSGNAFTSLQFALILIFNLCFFPPSFYSQLMKPPGPPALSHTVRMQFRAGSSFWATDFCIFYSPVTQQ